MPLITRQCETQQLSPVHQNSESYHDGTGSTIWPTQTPRNSNVTAAAQRPSWYLDPQMLKSALEEVARNNDLDKLNAFFCRAIQECDQRVPRCEGLGRALQTYFAAVCGVELSLEECVSKRKKLWRIAVADRLWRHTGDEGLETVYSVKDRE